MKTKFSLLAVVFMLLPVGGATYADTAAPLQKLTVTVSGGRAIGGMVTLYPQQQNCAAAKCTYSLPLGTTIELVPTALRDAPRIYTCYVGPDTNCPFTAYPSNATEPYPLDGGGGGCWWVALNLPDQPPGAFESYYCAPTNPYLSHWSKNCKGQNGSCRIKVEGDVTVHLTYPPPPSLFPQTTKATAHFVADRFDNLSKMFDYANILSSATTKSAAVKVGTILATQTFGEALLGNDELTNQHIELTVGMAQWARAAAKRISLDEGPGALLAGVSLGFETLSWLSNLVFYDPPDSNYKIVSTPQKISFPITNDPIADQFLRDTASYVSVAGAELHAAERWQAATMAHDNTFASTQLAAFQRYSAELPAMLNRLQSDMTALSFDIDNVDANQFPGGASAVSALFAESCHKPLPKKLDFLLQSYNLPEHWITVSKCQFAKSIAASDVNVDFKKLLRKKLPL